MQQIKFLPNNHIRLGTKTYKGYHVGELPPKFAFIYNEDQDKDNDGISDAEDDCDDVDSEKEWNLKFQEYQKKSNRILTITS